jgi:DNA-binding MarR family transcriptional regulator
VSTTGAADEPRWLDDDERTAWLSLAGVMTLLPAALDAQLQRDAGLNHFEYTVLAMLSERPSRTARMSELAGLANGSLSRLSHVARRLEGQGLLVRRACADDGRATDAVLTDAGYAKVVATAPGHVAAVRSLVFDALTPAQRRQLATIGDRILGQIHPGGSCPGQIDR